MFLAFPQDEALSTNLQSCYNFYWPWQQIVISNADSGFPLLAATINPQSPSLIECD